MTACEALSQLRAGARYQASFDLGARALLAGLDPTGLRVAVAQIQKDCPQFAYLLDQ